MDLDADIDPNDDTWSRIATYPDRDTALDHALVILAMGQACWVEVDAEGDDYHLHVPDEVLDRAASELREYDLELGQTATEPIPMPGAFAHSAGFSIYILWALSLAVIHHFQRFHPWIENQGASSSTGLVERLEWWRPLTALFLHADSEHLLGNLLSGLCFATLVCSSIGPWRGWGLILICGALGNLATSLLVWPEPYLSIGASSAVFAALGILSGLGFAWMLKYRKRVPWLRVTAPVIAGIVILGMTGSGLPESNTDVLGHVFGFTAGLLAGALWGSFGRSLSDTSSSETSKAESDAPT